jgi:hypothetical protein
MEVVRGGVAAVAAAARQHEAAEAARFLSVRDAAEAGAYTRRFFSTT